MNRTRPNFVFVFADDWGWGDLGCYGHRSVKTPFLDRLAQQGTLFTQFYVCSGVCSPSRAAVMSGQFPARFAIHGHFAAHDLNERRGMPNSLDPSVHTYTRLLRESGYAVGHFGKWHLGHGEGAPEPGEYGIDAHRVNAGNGPQLECGGGTGPTFIPGMRHKSSEIIVDHSIDFISKHRNDPFLVNVWLNDTHATLAPDETQLAPYEMFMPQDVKERWPGALATYYAAVTNADRHIGRLLEALDEMGLADDTVFIFSSDNGPEDIHIPNASHSGVGSPGPFRGRKRSLYEGGVRTPFIMRWPRGGVRAGAVDNETPLCGVDLMPTFCELAGADVPSEAKLDGESMAAVFHGEERVRSTPLLWEWRFRVWGHPLNQSPALSVRDGKWKLLFNPERDRMELYDIPNDRMELDNQAASQPEVVEELAEKGLAFQSELPEGPRDPEVGSNAYPWPGTF